MGNLFSPKSSPTTQTTTVSNPVGQLQGNYLGGLWDQASYMAGRIPGTMSGGGPVTGQTYLDQMQNIAQNNATATQGLGANLVPAAGNFVQGALTGGTPQSQYAAGPQIGTLGGIGQGAMNTGNYFANQLGGTAAYTPGAIAPYASGLTNLAGQYGGLTNAGYGSYGSLNSLAPGALQGGQNTAASLYGLAPQGMSAAWPSEQALMANSGMAISGNPAFSSGLMGAASGQYIDPSRNPALAGTLQAATTPLTKQFMTATAPLTASNFEGAGRYGSGAESNAQGQNQYALGQALGNATSNIVNNAYNTGLSSMLQAGSSLGGIYNTGLANSSQAAQAAGQLGQGGVQLTGNLLQGGGAALNTGYNTAGNLYGQGASALQGLGGTGLGGASSNYNLGGGLTLNALNAAMGGYGSAGNVANAGYTTGANAANAAGNLANTGQLNLGGIAQMSPDLANYPLSQLSTAFNTPWAPIQNFGALLGAPLGGNTTSTTTGQMYGASPAQNLLQLGLTAASIAKI